MDWLKEHRVSLIFTGVLLIGIGLLLYPSFSDYWNSFHQTRAIMSYAEEVADMNAADYAALMERARQYNERISRDGIHWNMTEEERADYTSQLSIDGSGNMGYIDIPKINVKLPLFHGTGEDILQTSIGHLEQTSLPVGGGSSHCVLSGHRGLSSARLFSDLDKIVEGDIFTLSVLNETFTYQVDRIRVVEPTDLSELQLYPGEDYCTLVTCTPYGINTHRLLVRGFRVENPDGEAQLVADALQIKPIFVAPFVAVPFLLLLLLLLFAEPKKKEGKRRGR